MRDKHGRFTKGHHWRKKKPHWDREWLNQEYTSNQRSAVEIAEEMKCTENNILYWLQKHNIPRRSMSEIRAMKHWGSSGKDNPMYGIHGADHPNWRGGATPERQEFYRTPEWKKASKEARRRDQHICQRCGTSAFGRRGHLHHIVSFSDSISLRADPKNLVLLCPKCHSIVEARMRDKKGRYTSVN